MERYKVTALAVMAVTWIELVIAAAVVFLDPSYNDFPYSTIVFTWPGVLEEIHRIWALVLIVVFIANLAVVYMSGNSARHLRLLSWASFILLILQAVLGGVTIYSDDHPANVIMHEGNAGVLMLVTALLAAYALFAFQQKGQQASPE